MITTTVIGRQAHAAFRLTLGLKANGVTSSSLQETKCVKAKAIVHQRGSTKTPQLKHSNVADWLDTPGEVVKKTEAVPPTLGADLVVVGTGAVGVGSLAPVLAGFSPFDGTLWPLAANVLPNPVSAPPPAALTWQRPQASLVCWE